MNSSRAFCAAHSMFSRKDEFRFLLLFTSLLLMPNPSADTFVFGILKSETLLHKFADLSIPKTFLVYRMRAIISRGLYILYPIFQCGL